MRHKVAGRKFSRPTGHRLSMLHNLVEDLIRYEKIETTEAKAKEVRPLAEKLITLGKGGTLHGRRQALAVADSKVVDKVFHVLAPRYKERAGGYTRVIKEGPRLGDAAPMARLELVE
ncbi:MAG: 50S ribosomal protein L17 [Dehalococcoidia bacterium]|nr:50S ribosomal protein L17 [Dehalococcoidia bacterium]